MRLLSALNTDKFFILILISMACGFSPSLFRSTIQGQHQDVSLASGTLSLALIIENTVEITFAQQPAVLMFSFVIYCRVYKNSSKNQDLTSKYLNIFIYIWVQNRDTLQMLLFNIIG